LEGPNLIKMDYPSSKDLNNDSRSASPIHVAFASCPIKAPVPRRPPIDIESLSQSAKLESFPIYATSGLKRCYAVDLLILDIQDEIRNLTTSILENAADGFKAGETVEQVGKTVDEIMTRTGGTLNRIVDEAKTKLNGTMCPDHEFIRGLVHIRWMAGRTFVEVWTALSMSEQKVIEQGEETMKGWVRVHKRYVLKVRIETLEREMAFWLGSD
jgi:hypothetical protein